MVDDSVKCFFCVELRLGCLIIAYLNMVMFVSVVISVYQKDTTKTLGVSLPVEIIIKILAVAIFLCFTIMLLVGVHQHKSGYVKAYMLFNMLIVLVGISIFILNITILGPTLYKFITNLLFFLLNIDFWRVVSDYYLEMTTPFVPPAKSAATKNKESSALLERTFLQNST